MRKVKIEDLEICDGEEPRQVTKDDLNLLEKMKQEWMKSIMNKPIKPS